MDEYEMELIRAAVERARPAIREAQRIATEAAPIVAEAQRERAQAIEPLVSRIAEAQRGRAQAIEPLVSRIAEAQRERAQAIEPLVSRIAEAQRGRAQAIEPLVSRIAEAQRGRAQAIEPLVSRIAEAQRGRAQAIEPLVSRIAEAQREWAQAIEPLADVSKQMRLTGRPLFDADRLLSAFGEQFAELSKPMVLPAIDFSAIRGGVATPPGISVTVGEPVILPETQLWEDLAATSGAEVATEDDLDEFAAPVLARRVRRLGAMRQNRRLNDAAERLEREYSRWETTDDRYTFPSIMQGFVNVLEEVARQIADLPEANLRQALARLVTRGTITASVRERIIEAWDLRNRRTAHGVRTASKELAGFFIYTVCRGLRDLLDAVDAQGQRHG